MLESSLESIISLVTNKLLTTILLLASLLALALLAKKYRLSLREVLRETVLRETKRGFRCVLPCVPFACVLKKACSLRSSVRSSVLRSFQWIPIKKGHIQKDC